MFNPPSPAQTLLAGRPTAAAAASAIATATGIPPSNVLCVPSTVEAADEAPTRAAGPWRAAVSAWYNAWAADRAGKMRPAFAPMRETVQFWVRGVGCRGERDERGVNHSFDCDCCFVVAFFRLFSLFLSLVRSTLFDSREHDTPRDGAAFEA